MKIFRKSFKIAASVIVIIILTLLLIVSLVLYLIVDCKFGAVMASLVSGIAVALIQFIISWQEFKHNEKLSALELIDILYNRDDRSKYEEYINKAKMHIDVMGVTAARFFNDFADTDINAPENAKVLIKALERNVHVRILLPSEEFLPNDNKKTDSKRVRERFQVLSSKYKCIELRCFVHTPSHSIFTVDDTTIVGPVFPDLESKYTPALHLKNSSPVAEKYQAYFEGEWSKAKE